MTTIRMKEQTLYEKTLNQLGCYFTGEALPSPATVLYLLTVRV